MPAKLISVYDVNFYIWT